MTSRDQFIGGTRVTGGDTNTRAVTEATTGTSVPTRTISTPQDVIPTRTPDVRDLNPTIQNPVVPTSPPPGVVNTTIANPCFDLYRYGEVLWDRHFQWKEEVDAYLSNPNVTKIAAFSDIALQQVADVLSGNIRVSGGQFVDRRGDPVSPANGPIAGTLSTLPRGTKYRVECTNLNMNDFLCDIKRVKYYNIDAYQTLAAQYTIESDRLIGGRGDYFITSGGKLCRLVVDVEDTGVEVNGGGGGAGTGVVGSGQVYVPLSADDIIYSSDVTTGPLWSDDQKYLQTPWTGSVTSAAVYNYKLDVYQSNPAVDDCAEVQYSIIYADYEGKGDVDLGGFDDETLTKAMYTQYANILLPKGQNKFVIDGVEQDYVYIIDVKRDRYRTSMDPGNWQLSLASCSFASSGTGNSNLATMKTATSKGINHTFVDSSKLLSGSVALTNKVYDVRLGVIEDGIGYTPSGSIDPDTSSFGLFYPNHGMIVLSGAKLDSELGFHTNRNVERNGYNAYRLHHSIKKVTDTAATDASGDALGFWGRYLDIKHSKICFVRVKNQLLNFSNNPTYVKDSEGAILDSMLGQSKAYYTTVGLYNPNRELLAVGKISKTMMSAANREGLFTVKISH